MCVGWSMIKHTKKLRLFFIPTLNYWLKTRNFKFFSFYWYFKHTYGDTGTWTITAHTFSFFSFSTFFTSCLCLIILVVMKGTLFTWFMSSQRVLSSWTKSYNIRWFVVLRNFQVFKSLELTGIKIFKSTGCPRYLIPFTLWIAFD